MIQIENVSVHGWEPTIRGMRNPMNSWDKSDSEFFPELKLGENDLKLALSLSKAGPDHSKFLRYITVTVDVDAPLYWWKEFKTYRAGRKFLDNEPELFSDPELFEQDIEINSCSTMHKIHTKPFDINDFSHEHLRSMAFNSLEATIHVMNHYRQLYLIDKEKSAWWQLIQLLPSSYNQRRTVQLNYAVLRNMYHARKNHKLDEWRIFCGWMECLPYSELITGEAKK